MEKWEYRFEPLTKAAWIRQIEQDLHGQSISKLNREWWPGEILIPIHHHEDLREGPVILPSSLFQAPPKIVEAIDLSNKASTALHLQLMQALKSGAERILLYGNPMEEFEPKIFLADVFTDILEWHWMIDQSPPNAYLEFNALSNKASKLRLRRSNFLSLFTQLDEAGIESLDGFSYLLEYQFIAAGNWIDHSSSTINLLLTDLKDWIKAENDVQSFLDKCTFIIDADNHFYKNIMQIRSLNIIWLNVLQHFSALQDLAVNPLECHIKPVPGEQPEQFLMKASTAALTASLSGCESICIHHGENELKGDMYSRIHRNIHHLLQLESGLPKGSDPIGGSYAVDKYTRNWAQRIWDNLEI